MVPSGNFFFVGTLHSVAVIIIVLVVSICSVVPSSSLALATTTARSGWTTAMIRKTPTTAASFTAFHTMKLLSSRKRSFTYTRDIRVYGRSDSDSNSNTSCFTQSEILEMEKLILSLSQIADDTVRREKLASLFEAELTAAGGIGIGGGIDGGEEIPRFAQLFQEALNTIGERVQESAREVAAASTIATNNIKADNENNMNMEEQHGTTREKSSEELQLWALIDMMVQSKTRVKLHMGKLGSKGEFR